MNQGLPMPSHDIQLIPIPTWIYDVDSLRFLDVNEAAIVHYGYSRKEFMEITLMDIRPEEDREMLALAIENLKHHKTSYPRRQYRHLKKNGELIYVEVNGTIYEEDGRLTELVIIHDITRLLLNDRLTREMQERLVISERRFKALVQEGSDLVTIVDHKGNFNFISDNFLTILGHHPEDLCGTSAFDYIHLADRERVWKSLQQVLQERCVTIEPFRFFNSKNQWRWISTILTNMLDDDAISGIVTNSKDITEAIQKRKELVKRNKELKEIAWTQSHQVRAPLSRAIALIDLLERESSLTPEQKELLHHLSASTAELDLMIKAIVKKVESRGKRRNK